MVPSNLHNCVAAGGNCTTMKDNGLTIRELQERFDERYGPRKPAKPKGPQLPNLPARPWAGEVKKAASNEGLYANIHAKRKRIASGSGESMRKPGTSGAPTAKAFKQSARTAKGKPSSKAPRSP